MRLQIERLQAHADLHFFPPLPVPTGLAQTAASFMRKILRTIVLLALLGAAGCRQPAIQAPAARAAAAGGTAGQPVLPGKQSDGSVLLPNQWSLRPVGKQVELGDFPINVAVHP